MFYKCALSHNTNLDRSGSVEKYKSWCIDFAIPQSVQPSLSVSKLLTFAAY